jgi:hypothetical protein
VKQAVSLIAGAVLLVGCGREPQKPEADAPSAKAAPVAAVPSQVNPVAKPTMPAKPEMPHVAQVAPVPVASEPVAATSRMPRSVAEFFRMPPPGAAGVGEATNVVAQAQKLFQQGEVNAAADLLTKALDDPAQEDGHLAILHLLTAVLLASERVDDAQAVCAQYATEDLPGVFSGSIVTRYLLEEKGDAAAALAWTERLDALPLSGRAKNQNLKDNLMALSAAGRVDEVVQRVPEVVARTGTDDVAKNMFVLDSVVYGMIKRSDFGNAERLVDAIEAAVGSNQAYADRVSRLRDTVKSARDKPVPE